MARITKKKLLIATTNPAKFKEYKILFKNLPLKLISLNDLGIKRKVKENGRTFKENAIKKAKFYSKLTKLPTIADDAGLEIDILNGEPGVKSRRWPGYTASDKELIDFTLNKLKDIPSSKRKAQLKTVLALAIPGQDILTFEGKIRGKITEKPKGKLIPGYPFRSIFYLPKFKKTFAQMSFKKESEIGHRRKIVQKVIPILKSKLFLRERFS